MKAATQATVQLGSNVSVDAYRMPDGSFRYGLAYASVLLGYARNYYRRLLISQGTKTPRKKLEALRSIGFTGDQISIKTARKDKGGSSVAHTVSYDDFCLIMEYEASTGNPKAIALLSPAFREVLRSRTQAAFGLPKDSLEEKQKAFQAAYEECLAENRVDLETLSLPGDELYYPQYKDWIDIEPWGELDWDQEAQEA